jgi:hypothetical protein
MPDEVDFILSAPFESAQPSLVRRWTETTERILAEVEKEVLNTSRAEAHWHWASEINIPLQASPNGVSREALQEIARVTRDGLQAGAVTRGIPEWPAAFPPASRERAKSIGRDINRADTPATIQAADDDAVVIEPESTKHARAFQFKRVASTVEGTLRSLSARNGWTEARILELFTTRLVWVRLTDEQGEAAAPYYKKRLIIEGLVAYDPGGHPLSVLSVSSLSPRLGNVPLLESLGSAPELTGGADSPDFIAKLRGHAEH